MKLSNFLLILSAFHSATSKPVNLTLGASSAFSHHCQSGCCEMSFDPTTPLALGFYCQPPDYCSPTTGLRHPGQSCRTGPDCLSQCCEDTVCQAQSLCFGQYILPFVIVFGILALFLASAILLVIVHKYRRKGKTLTT